MARRFNRTARNNPLHGGASDSAIGKAFVSALKADFARHGASRIRKLRKQQPCDYLRLVASLLPQAFSAGMTQSPPPPTENEFARELEILRAFAAQYDKAGSAGKD
jgi:hypothetical protein